MTGVNLGGGVSAGVAAVSETDQELRDSFTGGENFIARVALLSARKRAAEEAEASLQLGRDAAAALQDAQQKQAEADAALKRAKADLEDAARARAQAAAYAEKLRADAEQVLQRAEERHADVERRAEELKTERAALRAAQASTAKAEKAAQLKSRRCDAALAQLRDMTALTAEIDL